MNQDADVIVLGAGIVGVSAALHLQKRGRSVLLMDRRPPGEETSFGNAGLIERSTVIPYSFPRDLGTLLTFALGRSTAVCYAPRFLPKILPWLARYWWHSSPKRLAAIAAEMLPLIERSVAEHEALMEEAGARDFLRPGGWIEVYRSNAEFEKAKTQAAALERFQLRIGVLGQTALKSREPALGPTVVGGIQWHDAFTVSDPGDVTRAYADLFLREGGVFVQGDARTLRVDSAGRWTVTDSMGAEHSARQTVMALGPWSPEIFQPLGYRFPLTAKRGYHMHYRMVDGTAPAQPVCDSAAGFVLSPMRQGIRLSTGVELAARDAPPTPEQLARVEPIARTILPALGDRLDEQPWMGTRPCFPDMKPLIGPAPRHPGLWFAFGHAHHGFTLGPVTGRVLAEAMTGEKPAVDLAPFAARW